MFEVRCGLTQVGRARQQRHAPVGADVEALEEAEAERIVAGEPIIALLGEQQQPIELARRHRGEEALLAGGHFGRGEMHGHRGLPTIARERKRAEALASRRQAAEGAPLQRYR